MTEKSLIERLNKRVEIQNKEVISDGFGGCIEEWKKLTEVWAEIKPINLSENFEANKVQEIITHTITIRYLKSLTTQNRIKHKERIFMIKGIINSCEDDKILQINVEEIIYGILQNY